MPKLKAIYARVSTVDQHCEVQLAGLDELMKRYAWPDYISYVEKLSGKEGSNRPELERLLEDARTGKIDTVMALKMDRFGRSTLDTLNNIKLLSDAKVRFLCPSMNIDTDDHSPTGKFIIGIFALVAELERDFILERTRAGYRAYQKDAEAGKIGLTRHSKSKLDRPIGGQKNSNRRGGYTVWDRGRVPQMRATGMTLRAIAKELGVSLTQIARTLKSAA